MHSISASLTAPNIIPDAMNPRQSFTLCPSTVTLENEKVETRVIPGTIRQDWKTETDRRFDICPEVGLGIRAAPFELSINDRNLPLSVGTITPLRFEEYQAWIQSRRAGNAPSLNTAFPTSTSTNQDVLDENEVECDWKLRYLESEMERIQSRMAVVMLLEDRRRMRVHLLTLEAQLREARNQQSRNFKRPSISDLNSMETREVSDSMKRNIGSEQSSGGTPFAANCANNGSEDTREETPTSEQDESSASRDCFRKEGLDVTRGESTIPVGSTRKQLVEVFEMEKGGKQTSEQSPSEPNTANSQQKEKSKGATKKSKRKRIMTETPQDKVKRKTRSMNTEQ